MICGRALTGVIRNGSQSLSRSAGYQPTLNFTSRELSSSKAASIYSPKAIQENQVEMYTYDLKLGNKKFNLYDDGQGTKSSSVLFKLLATAGAVVGIGTGATYVLGDKSIFADYKVECAPEGGEDCIEKKCEESPCLRKLDYEEELILKANADLEKALKDVKTKAIEYTEAAMKAYCEAIKIMKEYMEQGYCAIDADDLESPRFEETWCCVYEIAKQRCEKVKDALQKGQCAWELLCRLREVVESGKACKYSSCNPLLDTAEQSLVCAERELLNLKAKMDCVNSDHEMVSLYRPVINDFRKDLKADVECVAGACQIQFAEQETAMMVNAAYKRVIRAHKEMAQVLVCSGRVPDRFQATIC